MPLDETPFKGNYGCFFDSRNKDPAFNSLIKNTS